MPSHCHAPTQQPTASPAQAVMNGVHRGWRAGAAAGTPFPPVCPGPTHPEVPTSLPPFPPPGSSPDSSSPTAQRSHSQFLCHFHTCPWEQTREAHPLLPSPSSRGPLATLSVSDPHPPPLPLLLLPALCFPGNLQCVHSPQHTRASKILPPQLQLALPSELPSGDRGLLYIGMKKTVDLALLGAF